MNRENRNRPSVTSTQAAAANETERTAHISIYSLSRQRRLRKTIWAIRQRWGATAIRVGAREVAS